MYPDLEICDCLKTLLVTCFFLVPSLMTVKTDCVGGVLCTPMLTAFSDTIMRFGKKEKMKVEGWKKQLMIFNMPSLPRQKAQTCIMVVWEPERDPREPSQKKRRSDDMRWHPAHLPSGLVSTPANACRRGR